MSWSAMDNLLLQLQLMVMIILYFEAKAAYGQAKPGCSPTCGSVSIPYPFGTIAGCSLDESFLVSCNETANGEKSVFFPRSNVSIMNISLVDHELRVSGSISHDCYSYDRLGNFTNSSIVEAGMFSSSKFPISSRRNMFTAIGCDTVGVISGSEGRNYTTGCVSLCNKLEEVENGTCSGIGCCQMSIPEDVIDYATATASLKNHSDVRSFNPCGFGFVVEEDAFSFSSLDLQNFQNRESVPVVLDWDVGNQTCQKAKSNATAYACQANYSECFESNNGRGYICKCNQGYQGNPYLLDGCQDINECVVSNPCSSTATCHNILGSVTCLCPKGHDGDGMSDGKGCSKIDKRTNQSRNLAIALGVCIGILVLLVGGSWIYWGKKRRKFIQLREKFFQQNGGILLQQRLSHRGSVETAKIFTAEELKNATNNYDESKILGQGGYGTVYKGVLSDNKVVAIKKSKICDQSQIEQFINEVIVLSQINHRNVVKILGCCLETEVPLLVYEFITNGTLSSHLHDHEGQCSSLSWKMRLKIAAETAGALAYLHSETSMPIIHRDVKTANILLDDNFIAKVADFGASRLIPIDQTQLTTLVQGTLGYLDPEYFHSSQLTEKSDVYSFGVVLAELLTGKKALAFHRPESERNLAMYFVSSMKDDRLLEILDDHVVVDDEGIIKEIKEVASLTKRCLRVKGEDRPTMREVTTELEGLMCLGKHPWGKDGFDLEEAEYLLKPNSELYISDLQVEHDGGSTSNSNTRAGFDSMKNHVIMPYDDGR